MENDGQSAMLSRAAFSARLRMQAALNWNRLTYFAGCAFTSRFSVTSTAIGQAAQITPKKMVM